MANTKIELRNKFFFCVVMLFDPNIRGKIAFSSRPSPHEQVGEVRLSFLSPPANGHHLSTHLSARALSSVPLALRSPVRLTHLKHGSPAWACRRPRSAQSGIQTLQRGQGPVTWLSPPSVGSAQVCLWEPL